MASCPENGTAIGFNADGDCLEIRNPRILGSDILPKYYKHKNVSSFVRQLNNYGFKTTPSAAGSSDTLQSFYHENFRRGRLDLLGLVSRRGGPKGAEKDPKTLQVEIAALKRRESEQRDKAREMEEQNRHLIMENNALIEENKRLKANWNVVRGSMERQKPPPPMSHHQQQQQHLGYHDGSVPNMYYAADPHQQAMYMGHMPVPLFTPVTQQQSMDPNMMQHPMTDEEFHRGGGPYGNMES
jgi:regulator of replication initiation timing